MTFPPSGHSPRPSIRSQMSYPVRLGLAGWLIAEFALVVLAIWGLGIAWTIVLFLGTSILGVVFLNVFGLKSLRAMQEASQRARDPREHLPSGMATVGSILLIVPGFVTDFLGLLLIFPPTRFLFKKLALRLSELMPQPTMRTRPTANSTPEDIIDGDVVEENPTNTKPEDPHQLGDTDDNDPRP